MISRLVALPSEHFFTRTGRFPHGEKRLTSVLAAVLEQVPSLAWTLARSWTDPRQEAADAGERCGLGSQETFDALSGRQLLSLDTEVRTPHKDGWVDLELRFGHGPVTAEDDVFLWVEVKHGADPAPGQLEKYVRNLPLKGRGTVLLLAPRSIPPYGEDLVPPSVPQRSWQAVAGNVRNARGSGVHNGTSKEDFLLEELYNYMQDQHLTDPEALRPEHLVALTYWDEADGAFQEVCRMASEYLKREWRACILRNEGGRGPVPRYGLGYWESWALDPEADPRGGPAALGKRWLDWNASRNPTVPQSHGRSLLFISGLTAHDIANLTLSDDDLERARLLEDGVEIDGRFVRFQRVTDSHERFTQVAQPDHILVGATLREQAESLGAWIIAGFKALTMPMEQLTPSTESGAVS
jgi:hypothetical protein